MLKGEAKKDYQREYMRTYMANRRAVKTPVKTQAESVTPDVKTHVQTIILVPPRGIPPGQVMPSFKPEGQRRHKAPRMGQEPWLVRPEHVELDADGQRIPED